jgi:hypothetical protein
MNTATAATEMNAVAAGLAAAELFVTIPESTLPNGTAVPAFLYAKYPAAKGPDGTLVLDAALAPWVNINYHDAVAASAAAGMQLARESQEIAVRLNVAAQDINWTGGKVGEGRIFQGLHKGSVQTAQPADVESADPDERSWHQLSTGEKVFGLAGNIYTWLFDDVQGDDKGLLAGEIPATSPSLMSAPFPSMERGMGWRPRGGAGWSGDALFRGGYWDDGDVAGVFALGGASPGDACDRVGFRCTKPQSGV